MTCAPLWAVYPVPGLCRIRVSARPLPEQLLPAGLCGVLETPRRGEVPYCGTSECGSWVPASELLDLVAGFEGSSGACKPQVYLKQGPLDPHQWESSSRHVARNSVNKPLTFVLGDSY